MSNITSSCVLEHGFIGCRKINLLRGLFALMYFTERIDVVRKITTGDFKRKYLNKDIPVIIKNLANETEAGKKWSIDYFKSTMGNIVVDVFDNGNLNSSGTAHTSPDMEMKFSDFLDVISKGEQSNLRMFLFNLFKFNKQLIKEFPCPEFFRGILDNKIFMFFGAKGTTVRIHYDIDMSGVLHTHFGGRKRVVLFAPEYSSLLYRLPFNTYSLIDIDTPDYEKYPGLRFVKGYDFILESGDSLFMPSGYWHYMTYLEGSFSVSYRKIAPVFKGKLEGLLNLVILLPLDKMLNRIFKSKWLAIKEQVAGKRANLILMKHQIWENQGIPEMEKIKLD